MTDRGEVDREIVGPTDAVQSPRFAGPATFARLPRLDEVDRADIVVLGVPFDAGSTYRPGSRFGPAAIRQASRLLRPYHAPLDVHPFGDQQVVDAGDLNPSPFDIAAAITTIEEGADALTSDGARALVLGGDHTISLPLLRVAHRARGPLALIHFDAHLDTWDSYFGAQYTHGTPFRRAAEEQLFLHDRSVHVGIRGPLYGRADLEEDAGFGFEVIDCMAVAVDGPDAIAARIRGRVGDAPVYVSVDIDVLDPAHAPGTGTPEAGGLSSRELLAILRALAGLPVVGADIVEVSPAYDHAEITAIAASHVAYELLALMSLGGGIA